MTKLKDDFQHFRELEYWELDHVSGAGNEPVVTVYVEYYTAVASGVRWITEVKTIVTTHSNGTQTVEVITRSWSEIMLTVDPD